MSSRFVFIIGTSVVLAFNSMQRRGVSRLQLLRKITWRTVVLLMLGFCFLNYSPRDGQRRCTICTLTLCAASDTFDTDSVKDISLNTATASLFLGKNEMMALTVQV